MPAIRIVVSALVTPSVALVITACGSGPAAMGEIDFAFKPDDTLGGPQMVAVGENVAWFKVGGDLVPVDARTREVGEPVELPDFIVGMAADGDDVWLALNDETLRRYDYATGTLGEPYEFLPDDYEYVSLRGLSMTVVDGAVWIELIARLVAVDIETGEIRADIAFEDLISIAGGDGVVWVGEAGTLRRIDANNGEVTGEVRLGELSGSVAASDGIVWMTTDVGLHRVDAATMTPLGEAFPYPERELPGSMVLTPEGLWGTLVFKAQVVRIDPETGKVTDRYKLKSPYSSKSAEVGAIAKGAGAVWVTTQIGNRAGVIVP